MGRSIPRGFFIFITLIVALGTAVLITHAWRQHENATAFAIHTQRNRRSGFRKNRWHRSVGSDSRRRSEQSRDFDCSRRSGNFDDSDDRDFPSVGKIFHNRAMGPARLRQNLRPRRRSRAGRNDHCAHDEGWNRANTISPRAPPQEQGRRAGPFLGHGAGDIDGQAAAGPVFRLCRHGGTGR
jgi:hypothetical protein